MSPKEGRTSPASPPAGRRERNKQLKLDRITAAARELFAEHGVDDVTTLDASHAQTEDAARLASDAGPGNGGQ